MPTATQERKSAKTAASHEPEVAPSTLRSRRFGTLQTGEQLTGFGKKTLSYWDLKDKEHSWEWNLLPGHYFRYTGNAFAPCFEEFNYSSSATIKQYNHLSDIFTAHGFTVSEK